MRTLYVVAGSPYPPVSGAPLRSWQNINILATRGPVSVFSVGGREPGEYAMPIVAEWNHVGIDDFPPSHNRLRAALRIATRRTYPVSDGFASRAIDRRLKQVIDNFEPDLVVLSNWKNALPRPLSRVDNLLLDMHNVESLLGTSVRHIRSRTLRELILWRWRKREAGLVRRATRTWVCGKNDADSLRILDKRLRAPVIWPNAIDVERYRCPSEGSLMPPDGLISNGATIIYVGLYRYEPNATAAEELIRDVFPLVLSKIPHARLLLVGDEPTKAMKAAASIDPRIIVTGKVDDVRRYLSIADLSVVPLRVGGGTRLKILECFAAGVPVVSTPKGAEGINATTGRDIRIGNDAATIAAHTITLLSDIDLRREQVAAAKALVQRDYSWASLAERLDQALPPSLVGK